MKTKKKLMLSVLSALIISTSAAYAASADQLYSDVPQDHWAVAAVTKLSNDGIVTGYGDGTFRGDRAITRYEMAQMIASARTHSQKASDEDKALIKRLSTEFSDELNSIGVRVEKLEKKSDNVKLGGVFCNKAMAGTYDSHTWWEKELFLNLDGNVGDGWNVHAGMDWKWGTSEGWNKEESFSDDYGTSSKEVNAALYHFYANGPIGKGLNTTIGLFTPGLQDGVVSNARVKGVEVDYAMSKNTSLHAYTGMVYEKNADLSSPWSAGFIRNGNRYDFSRSVKAGAKEESWDNDDSLQVYGFSVEHSFTPKTAAGLGYYSLKSPNAYGDSHLGIVALNLHQKLTDNLELTGFYSRGNQGYQNKAYDMKLVYNGSPWGSKRWGGSIGYRYLGSDALIMSSIVNGSEKPGSKGMEASVWYHFTKSIQLQNYFFFGKAINAKYAEDNDNHTAFFSNLIFAF